jgi:hypothetical protein
MPSTAAIAFAEKLGTTDPAAIKKVVSIDIGYPYPPMVDFEVRGSFAEELRLVEESQRNRGGNSAHP